MKNQSFKEKYLIFDVAKGKPGEDPKVVAAQVLEAGKIEAGKVDAKKEVAEKLTEAKAAVTLDQMKKEFEAKAKAEYASLINVLKFDKKISFTMTGDFDFAVLKDYVSKQFLDLMEKKDMGPFVAKFKEFFGEEVAGQKIDKDTLDNVIADLYASAALAEAKKKFENTYSDVTGFVKAQKAKKADYKVQVPFEITVSDLSDLDVTFDTSTSNSFDQDYKEYEKNKSKAPEDKEKKELDQRTVVQRVERAKAIKGSLAGKALLFMGVVKESVPVEGESPEAKIQREKDDLAQFEDIIKEDGNWFGKLIVWFCGGEGLLENPDFMKETLSELKGPHLALVEAVRVKVAGSPLSLKKTAEKLGVAPAEEAKDRPPVKDEGEFRKIVREGGGNYVPKEGLTLKDEFRLKDTEKLVVDFAKGGEMIIPKMEEMNINDTPSVGSKEKDLSYPQGSIKQIKITGKMPKNLVFKGPVQFKLEKV